MGVTNYLETKTKKTERVFGSSGSMIPREAAGRPGKAASDSRLLPRLIYKLLCMLASLVLWLARLTVIQETSRSIPGYTLEFFLDV